MNDLLDGFRRRFGYLADDIEKFLAKEGADEKRREMAKELVLIARQGQYMGMTDTEGRPY